MLLGEMSVLNDDGLPLDLSTVFLLFLMPNFILIMLTVFSACLLRISKNHPQFQHYLGEIAHFFAKGALDRIIKNMLRRFTAKRRQSGRHIPMLQERSLSVQVSSPTYSKKLSVSSSSDFTSEKKREANYILLIPFQLDLLLTVFVYKILTRDVYPETCQSYLTTYHNRQTQVVCWLKNINTNISNSNINLTLYQYCTNQTITYINYEHNDVMCTQYVFQLVNIIDTITNIFAWHQAISFIVTKSIVFSYWYQHRLRKTSCWSQLSRYQHRIILVLVICLFLSIYVLLFLFILPLRFILKERKRVDLTRHLLYACSKFITAIIVHVNLYTLYQWHLLNSQTNQESKLYKVQVDYDQSVGTTVDNETNICVSSPIPMMMGNNLDIAPNDV
jgi:hypothetical protein